MSSLLDIVGSSLFVGILIITILTINTNIIICNGKSISTNAIQRQAGQLGRIIEYDLFKVGHRVQGNEVLEADGTRIRFRADLTNSGVIDTVEYRLGSLTPGSNNPRDRQLTRVVNGAPLFISYNATRFQLAYYDSAMARLPVPLTAANRARVRTFDVVLTLETPEPVDFVRRAGSGRIDTIYTSASYNKLITARNLGY